MPWSRSRTYEKSIYEAIKNLEARSAATLEAAEDAKRIAHDALFKLQEIEEVDGDATVGRVLRLTIFCVVLIILAGFFTYSGAKGFANPVAIPSTLNSVQIAVQASRPSTPAAQDQPTNLPIYVSAYFYPDNDNYAEYRVFVPSRYAGKRYVLLLGGSARVDSPGSSPGSLIVEPALHSRSVTCRQVLKGSPAITWPCQIIAGTFPSSANATMPTGSGCPSSADDNLPTNAVAIDVSGPSHIATSLDWAHEGFDLPSVYGPSVDQYFAQWNGVSLDGRYRTGDPGGCLTETPQINSELTDAYPPPDRSTTDLLTWDSLNAGVALVTRTKMTEEISNVFLALGAATVALSIGFIPVAFEANRARKRMLKRRAKRPS